VLVQVLAQGEVLLLLLPPLPRLLPLLPPLLLLRQRCCRSSLAGRLP
jgi:hypothetical protein